VAINTNYIRWWALARPGEGRPETVSSRPIGVVTGASGGVGRATARVLARAGYDVALLARGIAGLTGAAKEVESEGGRAMVIVADVSRFDEVDAAATQVENELGPIDVWINNAMTTVFAPIMAIDPNDFRRAVEVTFLGQVWGTMAAIARMQPRNQGSIVNVGSALAYMGIPLQSAYCSSKFACRGFFESVRAELLHEKSGIRLSMVHLPAVNTPQFDWCKTTLDRHPQPVPPIYEPEVPARFILEVALNGRRTKVVGAWNKMLVAAGSLFPGVGNSYASLGAWNSQLTELPISPGRRANLHLPVDTDEDHGAHGIFNDCAGGLADPAFLRTLPDLARTMLTALGWTAREKAKRYSRGRSQRRPSSDPSKQSQGLGRSRVMSWLCDPSAPPMSESRAPEQKREEHARP
jgi:NAD(P)-dependent dehydrogenase (short-subunit alcohol dehydrogenase family)